MNTTTNSNNRSDEEFSDEEWKARAAQYRITVTGCSEDEAMEAARELLFVREELFAGMSPEDAMQEDIDNT